ncbi:copper transporter [Nocardia africana]|uniref:copper transporter n=1 Tax=Nocardia africana TaxID=134964 RepID=UPI0035A6C6FD
MGSMRRLVVSLTAIFLALAVGAALGAVVRHGGPGAVTIWLSATTRSPRPTGSSNGRSVRPTTSSPDRRAAS